MSAVLPNGNVKLPRNEVCDSLFGLIWYARGRVPRSVVSLAISASGISYGPVSPIRSAEKKYFRFSLPPDAFTPTW